MQFHTQVADLEEERRKLRMEVKFRAKYHGQHALEMGLSPDQLLLVEQLVDDIKHGKNDEARIVDQMQHRVRLTDVLQCRISWCGFAYAVTLLITVSEIERLI